MSPSAAPDWLVAEMPPGYQTRFAEIQRLSAEMNAMDRMARLLWDSGPSLREAVSEAFAALKYEIEPAPADANVLAVKLDARRRFLVHVADGHGVIEKKSPELAATFRLVHEVGGDDDRTLLIASGDPAVPPKARAAAVTPDALKLLSRVGVNVMPAAMLFSAWSLAQQDPPLARGYMEKVHAMDGGLCAAPKS
jgi:hypothetical protein